MRPVRLAVVVSCALLVLVGGWALLTTPSSDPTAPTSSSARSSQARSTQAKPSSEPSTALGMPTCPLASLPREAAGTVRVIHSDGPFPFPRNDGVVFGNREGHLPDQSRGYYHEYTVVTPGARNRSTKRIIAGGTPVTDPRQYFYTDDHYDSFCLVTGAGGRS